MEESFDYVPMVKISQWDAPTFIKQFREYEKHLELFVLPPIYKLWINKVSKIVNHLESCYFCRLGFYYADHHESFEDLILKMIFYEKEFYTCMKKKPHKL